MAGTVNSTVECDAENLKHLLNETAAACQKCLLAVDTVVASQRQGSLSTVNYASTAITGVDIEAMEKLHRRCTELEYQLAAERSHKEDQLTDVQQRHIDDIIVKYKERIKTIEDEKMELEGEIRRLKVVTEQHKATNAALTQRIESLTQRIESLTSLRGPVATVRNDDHVRFLEEQARQFHVDFESEKRDRIAAESQVAELQQQLAAANSQLQHHSLQQIQDISQRRQASLQYYHDQYQYDSSHPRGSTTAGPAMARHRHADGEDEIDSVSAGRHETVDGYDEVDSVATKGAPAVKKHSS